MCGQWSEQGYVLNHTVDTRSRMSLEKSPGTRVPRVQAQHPLSVCHRCGAEYTSEIKE
jgi:hypothetical protein